MSYSRWTAIERSVLTLGCVAILLSWTSMFVLDLNHPPGVRTARIIGAAIAISFGVLEALRPWAGFYAFLLFFPQMWILREVLQHGANDIFGALPIVTSGPIAAALGVGFGVRTMRAPQHAAVVAPFPSTIRPIQWIRVAMWFLAGAWAISAVVATVRLLHGAPTGWLVDPPDWRHMAGPSAFSALAPAISALRIVPELLLGLLLLNDLCRDDRPSAKIPLDAMLRIAGISAALIAAEVLAEILYQKLTGRYWSFDENPPSGPFNNRNTTSPALILMALICAAIALRHSAKRTLWAILATGLVLLACVISSRNGLFLAAAMSTLYIVRRWRGALWGLPVAAVALVAVCFCVPLPNSESISSSSLKRVVLTLEQMRAGDWGAVTSYRSDLYSAALKIYAHNPVLGSGPATFPMQAGPGAIFAVHTEKTHFMSAHSVPINLLAETGLAGALGWLTVWLFVPALVYLRRRQSSIFWFAALAVGVANLLDTVWFAAGMTTLSILFIWWASWEELNESHAE